MNIRLLYAAALLSLSLTADAAQQIITGDTLPQGRTKINANFTELYDGKQPLDSDLTAIAAITAANDDFIQRKAGAWINRTMAQLKTDLALTSADVGLVNVTNTSDANKPVSTAQQTALDLKAPLASPTLTGTPAAPTAAVGTNTTQLATTAHVFAERTSTATLSGKSISGASNTLSAIAQSSITNLTSDLAAKAPAQTAITVATSRAIANTDNGQLLKVTASGVTLTVPDTLASNFSTVVNPHSAGTSIAASGTTLLNGAATTLVRTGLTAVLPNGTANSYDVTDPPPSLTGTAPELLFNETDEAADEKLTRVLASGGAFSVVTLTDAGGAGKNILLATARTGTTPGYVQLGDAAVPVYIFGSSLEFVVPSAQIGGEIFIYGSAPATLLNATSGGTNQKRWVNQAQGTGATTYSVATRDDSSSPGRDAISILRGTGVAVASIALGNATDNTVVSFLGTATPRHGSTTLMQTTVALGNGAGAGAGTITNAPAAGNPSKWVPISDNGTTRYIPAW